ncbi:electron transport complex subunit RsxC [Providencia huaxiensis]|uniref:Ion-translocating oxidoreductase complex subunit C n=2 Tax=Providencia huashanensis TaxID=3037798 RepID=A0ABT9ALA7_9GAMM|nr:MULTISPECIES: electron transport complex subunit RsxC [Providencia]EJD6660970.1 electron transport complex subunit RsxC [Providencia rettgeri]ELR5077941.1 electron transport complex subunit RsxC [Providencia rettgeri]ELR5171083.1 electron transport complex subunit RsxC [Providencia rettgeri]ELR5194120.1 electron transport complex subunit RsxC [Providencia rettgeri]MBQ0306174.1 electron transport complex subunit RsxC [Providencia rettgeri]
MLKLFSWLKKENIWDFNGGIHPPEMKLQSSQTPMRIASVPNELIIPLQQHLGPEGELIVQVGEYVLKGQPLTKGLGRTVPVHASTSGVITAIEPMVTAHPSGLKELCVRIQSDGNDTWCTLSPEADYTQLSQAELLQKIEQAGIAGLGGAGFPTASKLAGGKEAIKTLIINAAECEPYITADDRLMQEHAQEVIEGCRVLQHLLNPDQVLIGIEDNKPEAIRALKHALSKQDQQIFIRVIPTKYPSGGAKQLTKILTGKEVPSGARSSQIGVLMQNVGTVVAIKRAVIDGQPLIERVVTVTGDAISKPGNFWTRLGTPVKHLLQQAGFNPELEQMVIMGGPLMGFTLPDLNVPVVKICNCLLVPTSEEMGAESPEEACIRCGLCVEACPAALLPQQLYWFSKGEEHEKAQKHNLFDCIECGACAYVCPSNIPLVQYYRQEKAEIREIAQEERRAAEAKLRFEAKQLRMERDKKAREERHKKAAVQVDSAGKDAVNAALARVKAKQSTASDPVKIISGELPDNSAVIAAREARKAQARARAKQAEKLAAAQVEQNNPDTHDDPRKAAVAAAIARAKAKKAAQQPTAAEPVAETTPDTDVDPRKAAVAAAIARAKAKKAAQQPTAAEPVTDTTPDTDVDPRKAAVAAAIARAKAKKAAQQSAAAEPVAETTPDTDVDPRKAAVAAAIARAKAKKAAQQPTAAEPVADTTPDTDVDPRKAAVAAAIARAKAKKAAQQPTAAEPVADTTPDTDVDPRKAAVAAAIARTKAKKAAQQPTATEPVADTTPDTDVDPRKAAVAAAIARAKAKKAAQQPTATEPVADTTPDTDVDPRKAAVAAAIARAKAKKAAQQPTATEPVADTTPDTGVDPRKAAVAAAIARAKAKKAAQAEQVAQEELTPAAKQPIKEETDPRKIAVAAAIARVKAKQAQKQNEQMTTE